MDDKKTDNKKIDFVIHEADMNRLEDANIRMYRLNIVLIVVIFLIVGGLLVYSMLPSESITGSQEVTDVDNSTVTNIGK